MPKAELKTKKTEASVEQFIESVADEGQREDAREIVKLMAAATKAEAKMWGTAIVGFGSQKLKYASGRELDWMIIGFSPRKANTVLYIGAGNPKFESHLAKLGKHKVGKGCLYIKRLTDVDLKVLKDMIRVAASVDGLTCEAKIA